MTDQTKYDVIISYSYEDEGWAVDILLSTLEDAGEDLF